MGCPCARKNTHPRQGADQAAQPATTAEPTGYRHPQRGQVWTGPVRVTPEPAVESEQK